MKFALGITAALLGLASATDCGKFTKCTLVNLSQSPDSNVFHATGTTLHPDFAVPYNPKDSTRGWSIECDTEGTIDYVKYFLEDGDVKTHYSTPFWIDGDNSGVRVNRFENLNECGPKTIEVEFYIWSQGDDAPCDATTIRLEAECPLAPVKPPTMAPAKPPTNAPVRPCHPITCPANSIPTTFDGCVDSLDECVCLGGYIKVDGKCVRPPTMAPVKPPTNAPVKPPTMAPVKPPTPPKVTSCSRSAFKMLIVPTPVQSGWKIETEYKGDRRFLQNPTTAGVGYVDLPTIDERYYHSFRFQAFHLRLCTSNGVCGEWAVCSFNTPIALDLDRSGAVERIVDGEWHIDVTGNGDVKTLHEWFAPTEGILIDAAVPVVDGVITGEHLFGDMGGTFADGFAKLGLRDANQDGVISGEELNGFAVWVDANSNAKVDAGEVLTLAYVGVHSLIVKHDENYQSFASLDDGSLMLMEDLWFARR